MPLSPGTRLGPYEVVSLLGAGGMGEVYDAKDTRLNRLVALKVLPPELVADDERRRRFIQEAQLASALQHPHIVTIYDIGRADDGSEYLAMELVRGHTLDTVIPAKGLRLQDALRYAVQITDALAAAHAAGIVHRDLKPGNLMVTDQGQIKILDFGLATLTEKPAISPSDETRALIDMVDTGAGMILGTVAYMSPEQAEGHRVDARSDIFSFGAIFYEMLSGQRAFKAGSTPGTLAAVINLDPPQLHTVATHVPHDVERLVSRCLRKDLSKRAQHVSDIKVELEELQQGVSGGPLTGVVTEHLGPRRRTRPVALAAALAAAVAAVALFVLWRSSSSAPSRPTAFVPAPLTTFPGSESAPTFSPDGSQVAFTWLREGAPGNDVYVQLVGGTGSPLRLTEDEGTHQFPAWSPDGKTIALWHAPRGTPTTNAAPNLRLVLISPLGGAERQLLEWTGTLRRITWSPDGRWLAVSPVGVRSALDRGITIVSAATGETIEWAKIDPRFAGSAEPSISPDGRRIAFIRQRDDFSADLFVADMSADGRPASAPRIVPNAGQAVRVPSWMPDSEHIVLIDGVSTTNGNVVRVRIDSTEPAERIGGLEHPSALAISRDGSRLAIARGGLDADIWRLDVENPAASGPIVRSTLHEEGPALSPDGRRIAFSSNRLGAREIWVSDITGDNAIALTAFGGPICGSASWSPDGTQIVFDARPGGNSEIFTVSASGGPVRQLTADPAEDARPAWSKDGRWIFFASTRGGQTEIWRMAADGAGAMQITKSGALAPVPADSQNWIYYSKPTAPFPLHRINVDGTDDAVVIPARLRSPAVARGTDVWFFGMPKPGTSSPIVSVWNSADNTIREVQPIDFPMVNVGFAVAADERTVYLTRADSSGTDLLLVSEFR